MELIGFAMMEASHWLKVDLDVAVTDLVVKQNARKVAQHLVLTALKAMRNMQMAALKARLVSSALARDVFAKLTNQSIF